MQACRSESLGGEVLELRFHELDGSLLQSEEAITVFLPLTVRSSAPFPMCNSSRTPPG